MKKLYFLNTLLFCVFCFNSFSQTNEYVTSECDFTYECPLIKINQADTSNIWQIGLASKFTDTITNNKAIMTDTLNHYFSNVNSYFEVAIPNGGNDMGLGYFYINPATFITFRHKFQTDSLFDGGYIMVSYDKINWENILNSNYSNYGEWLWIDNFYYDELLQGEIPAFTGVRDWAVSRIQWNNYPPACKGELPDTIYLRFYFKSDSIQTNKAGWIIDDIKIGWVDLGGSVADINKINTVSIYPNPASNQIQINISEQLIRVELYNLQGKRVLITNDKDINIEQLPCGVYIVKVITSSRTMQQKLIINEK